MVRPAVFSAFAVAALSAVSAFAQLNPTVNVLAKPQAPVPGECEEGLAKAQPRTLVAEAPPQPRSPASPPAAVELKTHLRAVETAANQGDRDGFQSALASARTAIAAYPTGGERDAANDVLRVYGDLATLWDYAFTSPAGSFFDATTNNGAMLKMMQRYPGFASAIADSTVIFGGNTVYPSSESRKFLAAEASSRLARLGVRPPERIAQAPAPGATPSATPAPAPATPPAIVTKPSAGKEAGAVPAKPLQKAVPKPKVKVAEARTTPRKARRSEPVRQPVTKAQPAAQPTAQPARSPAAGAPQPKPQPGAPPQPAPSPQPEPNAPPSYPANMTTAMPPAMMTAPPESPQEATATTSTAPSTATAATSTTTPAPASQGGGRVNLLFAIILIVVGIGVLIVLLRASD